MFSIFDYEVCGILVPRPEVEPATPALEGQILTPGAPGESFNHFLTFFRGFGMVTAGNSDW